MVFSIPEVIQSDTVMQIGQETKVIEDPHPVTFSSCQEEQFHGKVRNNSVALSSAESEYMALSSAVQEAIWLRNLLKSLGRKMDKPLIVFEDNQAAISLTRNPQFHGRAKHVDIRYHFTREQVKQGTVDLQHCRTTRMLADILTKSLSKTRYQSLRNQCIQDK